MAKPRPSDPTYEYLLIEEITATRKDARQQSGRRMSGDLASQHGLPARLSGRRNAFSDYFGVFFRVVAFVGGSFFLQGLT